MKIGDRVVHERVPMIVEDIQGELVTLKIITPIVNLEKPGDQIVLAVTDHVGAGWVATRDKLIDHAKALGMKLRFRKTVEGKMRIIRTDGDSKNLYPWIRLEVGESITIVPDNIQSTRIAVGRTAREHGMRFKTTTYLNRLTITRTDGISRLEHPWLRLDVGEFLLMKTDNLQSTRSIVTRTAKEQGMRFKTSRSIKGELKIIRVK